MPGSKIQNSPLSDNFLFSSPKRDFSSLRIMQKNIVYVIGLSENLTHLDLLSSFSFFGQYGNILKIVINQSGYSQKYQNDTTYSAYVTYSSKEEAALALLCIDNCVVDNHTLRCSFGTTKYCNFFLKGVECMNKECLYLHEWADEEDVVAKDEIIGGNKQLFYEQQKIAISISNIFNKERKYKLLKRIKGNADSYGFPSVDSVYKKKYIYELAKTINQEKNKGKKGIAQSFHHNLYYDGSKEQNVNSIEMYNSVKNEEEEVEYVLVREPNKKKKWNTIPKYNKINNNKFSKSDSGLETNSNSSKSNSERMTYQKTNKSRFDFVIEKDKEQGIEVPSFISELIDLNLSLFVYEDKVNHIYNQDCQLVYKWNNK